MLRRNKNRPVWFLDIDGVLAPLDRRQSGLVPVTIGGYMGTLLFSPSIIARVNHLHSSGACDVHWLTTWDDDAVNVFAPRVGLKKFKVHREPTVSDLAVPWWKQGVVTGFAESGRRFVWTDDEASDHGAVNEIAATYPGQGLAIAPEPAVGLTHAEVDRIEAFLAT